MPRSWLPYTNRTYVRRRIEDAEELAAIYEPYVRETAITFEYVPPTPAEFAERMRKTMEFFP